MKDKELFKQLHSLNNIKPDASWKKIQRDIMLSQINVDVTEIKDKVSFWSLLKLPLEYAQSFSQPVVVTFLVAFLFLTGSFVGLRASQNTKPGDSLYLAKIVGEKTQLALALTDRRKAELGIGFAVRRVEEIKQVIAEDTKNESRDDKVEQLLKNFKRELSAAKLRIGRISEASTGDSDKNKDSEDKVSNEEADINTSHVFSAGSGKEEKGLEVFDIKSSETKDNKIVNVNVNTKKASTSIEQDEKIKKEVERATGTPESILQQASDLLETESYDEILNALDDAGEAVDQFSIEKVNKVKDSDQTDVEDLSIDNKKATNTEE